MTEKKVTTAGESVGSRFSRLFVSLDYPLYVVTTAIQNECTGCLVGFATQCSIHPPRFLICISKANHTYLMAQQATLLAVHVVERDNKAIAELFGGETGDVVDKFRQTRWRYIEGVPVLEACPRWFIGSVVEQIDFGDHVGHLLEPVLVQHGLPSSQLTHQQARDIKPGHDP